MFIEVQVPVAATYIDPLSYCNRKKEWFIYASMLFGKVSGQLDLRLWNN